MKRSQVNAYITRWEGKGALYIVAHARFRRKRGKNPSEPYKNERNPRKALSLALAELRTYEPLCGDFISASIVRMAGIAKFTNQEVSGEFNGITVTASPSSQTDTLVWQWQDGRDQADEEYRRTPEYKRQQEETAAKTMALQIKLDGMMELLETLNFDDLKAVINWFDEIQEATDHVGVSVPSDQSDQIVNTFVSHGYLPGVNCDDEFNNEDKENVGRWLVGQALSFLVEYGLIHQMYPHFAQKWREKFLGSPRVAESA